MRRLELSISCLWLCVCIFLVPKIVEAQSDNVAPLCVAKCTSESLARGDCASSDLRCRCSNKVVNDDISSCVVTNCNIQEALDATRIWARVCDRPHDNHHEAIKAAIIGSGVAGFGLVACRIVARACTVHRFWWDDWSHVVAGVLLIPLTTFICLCASDGMGYHLYDITFSSISQAQHMELWYYLSQIFWLLEIGFIKISILFLYLRIFPDIQNFRVCVIGTMTFVVLSMAILVPMAIFQCIPVYAVWAFNRSNAQCLSISGIAYASAGTNIATEIAIFILPLPLLRTLRASKSQKAVLYVLFGCGILVIGIASARIPSLKYVEAVNDPTYLNAGVIYWTSAETAVAHFCAAAPAIRPLYVKIRDIFRWKRRASANSNQPILGHCTIAKPCDSATSRSNFQQTIDFASFEAHDGPDVNSMAMINQCSVKEKSQAELPQETV